MMHYTLRAEGHQLLDRTESPGDPDGAHPGGHRGFHVRAGVAYEEDLRRLQSERLRDFHSPGRVRLAGNVVALAEDRVEGMPGQVVAYAEFREGLRLVGEHAQLHRLRGERGEEFRHAVVGACGVVPAAAVGGPVECEYALNAILAGAVLRENALDEHVHAVADKGSVGINRMRRKPCAGEGFVGGIREVLQRVEQGSVEVEDGGAGSGHGAVLTVPRGKDKRLRPGACTGRGFAHGAPPMVREIVLYGDPVLREKCKPVTEITPDLHALAADMLETMEAADGVGLAAPQIGIAIQFAVIDVRGAKEPLTFLRVDGKDTPLDDAMPLVFMNPELSYPAKEKAVMNEGCLSFPEVRADIRRPDVVKAKLKLLDGRTVEIETDGLLSRAIQHETDHLMGMLFIDRASPAVKLTLKRKIQKMWDKYAG